MSGNEVQVNECVFCGSSHILPITKNSAGDEVIKCPNSGKVVCADFYED